jgi:hypothetical protein
MCGLVFVLRRGCSSYAAGSPALGLGDCFVLDAVFGVRCSVFGLAVFGLAVFGLAVFGLAVFSFAVIDVRVRATRFWLAPFRCPW